MNESTDEPEEGLLGKTIRPGLKPNELILDPVSSLEDTFMACGCFQVFLLFIFGGQALDGGDSWAKIASLVFFVGIIVAFVFRSNLDDHYVIDTESKDLFFQRVFFGRSTRKKICSLSQLHGMVVKPARRKTKQSVWWDYGLALVQPDGTLIEVISPSERDHGKIALTGKAVAQQLGLHFEAGEPEKVLKVVSEGSQAQVSYEPFELGSRNKALVLVVFLIMTGALAAFVAGTVLKDL